MNVQTVIANLKNTIAGKELALKDFREVTVGINLTSMNVLISMLKVNIDELNRILADLESCNSK